LDDQVGRLVKKLEDLGVRKNTLIFFCSDNGPERLKPSHHYAGVTGGLRGRKLSLFSGGISGPAFISWPAQVKAGTVSERICVTMDFLPTIFDVCEISMPDSRPLDGESLRPLMEGKEEPRRKSIVFRFNGDLEKLSGSAQMALIHGKHKFLTNLSEDGNGDMLYNIIDDREEKNDILAQQPELVAELRKEAQAYLDSFRASFKGNDYPAGTTYKPVGDFYEIPILKHRSEVKKKSAHR
jgi:arylsulfatase A-like enzyme